MQIQNKINGFSLIEILVAMAILAISTLALSNWMGNALTSSSRAEDLSIATMLARQKMTQVEIDLIEMQHKKEIPDDRVEQGNFEEPYEDYTWELSILRVEIPAPVMGEDGGIQNMIAKRLTKEMEKSLREVKLVVKWGDDQESEDSINQMQVVTHINKY